MQFIILNYRLSNRSNLEYDRDIFDIEIEFDDEVVKRIERTETARL